MNVTDSRPTTSAKVPHIYDCYCERQVLAAIACITALVGLFGNILVVISIISTKRLRTRTNIFVFNLSVADLLTCLILPLNAVAVLSDDGYLLPDGVCIFNAFMLIACIATSVNTLACIAVNRLLRITQSSQLYHRVYKPRNIFLMLVATWMLPMAVAFIPIVSPKSELGYEPKYSICLWLKGPDGTTLYTLIVAVLCYPVQLFLTLYSYCRVFLYARKRTKALLRNKNEVPSISNSLSEPSRERGIRSVNPSLRFQQRLFKRQIRLTKNLFYVVCAFLLCLTPYTVNIMIPGRGDFLPYTAALLTLNSCLNPMIYAVKHPYFKKRFRELLCCNVDKVPNDVYTVKG